MPIFEKAEYQVLPSLAKNRAKVSTGFSVLQESPLPAAILEYSVWVLLSLHLPQNP